MLHGGGRFFGQEGWPSSTVVKGVPSKEDDQAALIDVLQDWKSAHYQELVGAMLIPGPTISRAVPPLCFCSGYLHLLLLKISHHLASATVVISSPLLTLGKLLLQQTPRI